jgi:DNA-binding PucR family transcriptional regulator
LFAYFDAASNTAEAARRLHVHVNTLLKRLERVGTLLGDDWRKPENALRLHLAIRLHRLSQHL